jgi:signal transduction histidine kinase
MDKPGAKLEATGRALDGETANCGSVDENLLPIAIQPATGQATNLVAGWSWNVTTGEFAWSQAHFRMLRLNPTITKPSLSVLLDRVHPADRRHVRERIEEAMAKRQDFSFRCRIVLPDRSTRDILSLGHSIASASGELLYVGSLLDITGLRQIDEPHGTAHADAARSTNLGELAATIAHEISQPLAAIVNDGNACLHWLDRKPADLREAGAAVRGILVEAKRATGMIKGLRSLLERSRT